MENDGDIIEGILGKDAPDLLQQAADRHGDLMSEEEKRAISDYIASPAEVSDPAKSSLCELLTAIADDFQSRRRALVLAQNLEKMRKTDDEDEDEFEVPDEDGRPQRPEPGSLLDDLDL